MGTITRSAEPRPSHAEEIWTTPLGRGFCWLLLFSVFATVTLLRYSGVRELTNEAGPAWLAATWQWLPSYLAALGLPFMWPAIRRRAIGRVGPVDFLPEVVVGGGTIMLLEALDGTGILGEGMFSGSDFIAGFAGALTSFLLYRALAARENSAPTGP